MESKEKQYAFRAILIVGFIVFACVFGSYASGGGVPNGWIGDLLTTSYINATAGYYVGANQVIDVATAATFATVDTGQGANELYDMDQNVLTTSDVNFSSLEADDLYVRGSYNVTQLAMYPQQPASYIIWKDGSTIYAKSGTDGSITTNTIADLGALVNSLIATGNNIYIFIREGNYTASTQVTWSDKFVHIEGVGTGTQYRHRGTVIAKGFDGALFLISYTNSDYSGFIIENMYLDGASASYTGRGISINNAKGFVLRDLVITDFKGESVHITNSGWHRLFNVFVSDGYNHLIYYDTCVDWQWYMVEADTCLNIANNTDAVHLVNSQGEIIGGHFESGSTYGRYGIYSDSQISVIGTRIAFCGFHGIQLYTASNTKIIGATIWNTNMRDETNGVGINIQSSGVIIEGCIIEDRQGSPTMNYAIRESGIGYDNSTIIGNVIKGMKTASMDLAYTNTIVRNNQGYKTENCGTVTLLNGNTTITVSHGCDYTPSAGDIQVHPIESLGSASFWWVDTITSTQFTIHVNADPGQDVDFAWSVDRH